MTTHITTDLRRAFERALLARDGVEIAAATRLLSALKVEAGRKKSPAVRLRRRRAR